ncbi:MAG: FmdB family zinc ribbon protein [Planctomycetota bacterium]
MPIFEFTCEDCGRECEILVRSSSRKPVCPGCGGVRLRKKPSMFAAGGSRRGGSSCDGCSSTACSTCKR